MRQCEVYLHGIKAGVLIENDNREFMFTYDKAYLLSENCDAVSLTLPLRPEPYSSPFLFSVFANMLSEGDNRQIQSQLLRIDPEDDFGILLATCQYDTVGAITVKPIEL
ncbi:MAG: HipA N-terminal domain-containing protein [Bacteroidales bacterium]|jgi:HipA-like protein|nr:HipA N-terminal domain-containing protein [Bacteroidales bacterium]